MSFAAHQSICNRFPPQTFVWWWDLYIFDKRFLINQLTPPVQYISQIDGCSQKKRWREKGRYGMASPVLSFLRERVLRPVPFHPVSTRPVPTHVLFLFMTCRLPEERKTTLATSTRHVVLRVFFVFSRVRSPFSLLPRWMPLRDLSTSVSVPVSFRHFVDRVKSGQACKAMKSAYFEPWAACFACRDGQAGHGTSE